MRRGQSLVEIMVIIGLLTVLLPGLITAFVASREGRSQQQQRLTANTIMKETQDAVRNVREQSWQTFSLLSPNPPNTIYYPSITAGGLWQLNSSATPQSLSDSMTRQVVLDKIYRNSTTQQIDPTGTSSTPGDVYDPSTIKATTTVAWSQPYVSSTQSVIYLTRFRGNLTHTETTVSDFSNGSPGFNNTVPTPSPSAPDGSVVLSKTGGGTGDWCNPQPTFSSYPLGGSIGVAISSVAGNSSGNQNLVYFTTGHTNNNDHLNSVLIPDAPTPIPTQGPSFSGQNKGYGLYSNQSNSYIYFTSDHPNTAVDIVSKADFSQLAGFFDDGANGSVTGQNTSVFINGNVGYVTSDIVFYTFDITSIKGSSSQTKLGSVPLANSAKGNKVIVANISSTNYAFVATTSTSSQLQIINVQNPNSPGSPISLNLNNNQSGIDLAVYGTYAYIVTNYASPNFFVVDISNPTQPRIVGSATTTSNMSPTGIALSPDGTRAIIVGSVADQYQVFNIETASNPFQCGKLTQAQLNGATQLNAVSTLKEVDTDVFSYVLATTGSGASASNQQLFIIAGGGSGGGSGNLYFKNGTFESNPFYPGQSNPTSFNRFTADINQSPPTTSIQMQVAVANQINNSCTPGDGVSGVNYNGAYVGPGGNTGLNFTSTDNTTIIGTVPFGTFSSTYTNPGKCFRYKVIYNSDGTQTPSFNDITVNYSP